MSLAQAGSALTEFCLGLNRAVSAGLNERKFASNYFKWTSGLRRGMRQIHSKCYFVFPNWIQQAQIGLIPLRKKTKSRHAEDRSLE